MIIGVSARSAEASKPQSGLRVLRKSELVVLRAVSKRALTQRELASATKLSPRAIRYALTKLLELGIVKEIADVYDLRKKRYAIKWMS